MFKLEQIKEAHSKVKSGADFPRYVEDIKSIGVMGYETFVSDGHTLYYGDHNFSIQSPPKYPLIIINDKNDNSQFGKALKMHQQGKSDYFTFCKQCAANGVEKWTVRVNERTCIYYNKEGNEMLKESIPSSK